MTIAHVITRQLDDIAAVVMSTDEATYVARPIAAVSGSIGEHVRHCLDHIGALVAATGPRPLSYDRRERGTAVERDSAEALRSIMRLKSALDRWGDRATDEPLCVVSMVTAAGELVTGWSTLGREVAFVNDHTIHHKAVCRLAAPSLVRMPDGRPVHTGEGPAAVPSTSMDRQA